jgi:monoamine oxidase
MKSVLMIGGGVSGLVAARALAEKGCEVVLLEAKDRLGGRILTRRVGNAITELGAEFVHGRAEQMLKVIRAAGLELIDASEQNRVVRSPSPRGEGQGEGRLSAGKLKKVDLWERVGKVIGKINPHQPDEPFGDWLARANLDAETNELALAFVEGFNASDARVIGAHALLRAEYASEKNEGDKQSRIREGYEALVASLAETATHHGAKIELNARVRSVQWKRGHVEVALEDGRHFEADAAVITLPLGVLKTGRVQFEPSLVHKRDAIEGLQFGNVAKLVLLFRRHWWEDLKLKADFGFIHSFAEPIPTWWSDSRAPVLIGWAAGPKGDRMLDHAPGELLRAGFEVLSRIFSRDPHEIEADLAAFEFHDWRADPDIGGAYSYIPVNGLDLPKALAAPVENTLFFAGEATAMDAQMGTVSGAIESGFRVVKEMLGN